MSQGRTSKSNATVAFALSGTQFGFRPLKVEQPMVPKVQTSVVPVATPRRGQAWGMAAYLARQA